MILTILGSGTMLPVRGRYPSGYLLEARGTRLLLDCGHTALARLTERGVNLHALAAVCVTHFHTDHFSGLLPLLHARWVDDVQRRRPHRPLTIIGPRTLQRRLRILREVFWPEPGECYPVRVIEGAGTVRLGEITVLSFPVHHVPWFPSVAYRITVGSRSLVYTGDLGSRQTPAFFQVLRGASALLIEGGTLRPAPNHFTPLQAVALARAAGIPRLLLTHVRADHLARVRRLVHPYRAWVRVVSDGDRFRL